MAGGLAPVTLSSASRQTALSQTADMGFDAFLQCNVEDRDLVVELATGFYNLGYRVWLDDDPTSSKIGLTLLSPSYLGTSAHDRLRDWTHAEAISNDTFEAALLAASTSPVSRHLLPLWKRLRDAQVHCYSPLSFDESDCRGHTPRLTRADSARLGRQVGTHDVARPKTRTPPTDPPIVPSLHSPLGVLQTVVLKRALPQHGLVPGDVGVVADVSMSDLVDVEFGLVDGRPRVRASVRYDDVEVAELCDVCWRALGDCGHPHVLSMAGVMAL